MICSFAVRHIASHGPSQLRRSPIPNDRFSAAIADDKEAIDPKHAVIVTTTARRDVTLFHAVICDECAQPKSRSRVSRGLAITLMPHARRRPIFTTFVTLGHANEHPDANEAAAGSARVRRPAASPPAGTVSGTTAPSGAPKMPRIRSSSAARAQTDRRVANRTRAARAPGSLADHASRGGDRGPRLSSATPRLQIRY
jgi:hypothetical protein